MTRVPPARLDNRQFENRAQDLRGRTLRAEDGRVLGTVRAMMVDPASGYVGAVVLDNGAEISTRSIRISDDAVYYNPPREIPADTKHGEGPAHTARVSQPGPQPTVPTPAQPSRRPLRTRDLVLRSKLVLDISSHVARAILLGGAIGVVLVAVASLTGDRAETIAVDKLLHSAGYAILALLFVLALRPRQYAVAILGLAGLSYLIELIQPLNARTLDAGDAAANTIGLALGAAIGLTVRWVYGYVKTELYITHIRRRLISVPAGAVIVREGELIDQCFIVKQGLVLLYRQGAETPTLIACMGPGDMFGLLAEILRIPQYATAVAAAPTQLYRIDYDDVIADAGGRKQPVGAVINTLAIELRDAWEAAAHRQRPSIR